MSSRDEDSTPWSAAWRPRQPDAADRCPSPHRTRLAEQNLARGRELRAVREALDALRARPARPMIGPALAARLGVEPTTPALGGEDGYRAVEEGV